MAGLPAPVRGTRLPSPLGSLGVMRTRLAAGLFVLVIAFVFVGRSLENPALSNLTSVRAGVVAGIVIGFMWLVRRTVSRWALGVAVVASGLVASTYHLLSESGSSAADAVLGVFLPLVGVAVVGLLVSEGIIRLLGDQLGHPDHCSCDGPSQPG
jgi:hypothetical protein